MKTQESNPRPPVQPTPPPPPPAWHDPEELHDRLTRPKATYEQALAQTRAMLSQPVDATSAPSLKNND